MAVGKAKANLRGLIKHLRELVRGVCVVFVATVLKTREDNAFRRF